MLCFIILVHAFSDESASEIDAQMKKNRCQNDALKKLKIDAKMAPKSFKISFIFAPKSRAHFRNVSKTCQRWSLFMRLINAFKLITGAFDGGQDDLC